MPASSKISAAYWSYAVSMGQRSPRALAFARSRIVMRLSAGQVPVPGVAELFVMVCLPSRGAWWRPRTDVHILSHAAGMRRGTSGPTVGDLRYATVAYRSPLDSTEGS